MLDVFAAPPRDRYQIITEHDKGHIIAEDTGLGLERSNGIVIIQIFQQGRSTEQKVAVYAELAKRLEAECGVRPEDLIISVMSNRHSDWSFGLGQAQFVDGTLHSSI
jgi:Tautomerase enzyme